VNLDLDPGESYGVCRICTFSVSCVDNVGLMIIGIKILSVPTAWERNLRPESTRALKSWECIMTRGLGQWVEAKEGFVQGEIRFVFGAGGRIAGKHPKVIRKRGGFARIEQVFDRNRSVDSCEASVGPLEV